MPLTEQGQKTNKQSQGDIDLISERKNELLFIEAKISSSAESLLKAILEIFVYVTRLSKFGLLKQFQSEYNKLFSKRFVPCILTFKNATSGKQILEIKEYPKLLELINKINEGFNKYNISELEYLIIVKPDEDYSNILKVESKPANQKDQKILLRRKIQIYQYFPGYCENDKIFQDKLEISSDITLSEMLFRSYLLYHRKSAIKYIINKIYSIQTKIQKYSNTYPKNKIIKEEFDKFLKKSIQFIDAYLIIASDYIFPDFLELNLELLNPNRIKTLVPIISAFKTKEVLDKLIDLYKNIWVIKSKDYDGVSSQEIDPIDEKIIISALCQFDNPEIISSLKDSLLKGKYNKDLVVDKLLQFHSKSEIIEFVKESAETNNIFISGLTNKKENANWVINYLNEL